MSTGVVRGLDLELYLHELFKAKLTEEEKENQEPVLNPLTVTLAGSFVSKYEDYLGTIDYVNGLVTINGILISSSSNVDGSTSTKIRITALSDSNDVIPVRNQLLEIDFVNSTITAKIDASATTGIGYTTTTTGTTTSTTVNTTSSTTTSSSY